MKILKNESGVTKKCNRIRRFKKIRISVYAGDLGSIEEISKESDIKERIDEHIKEYPACWYCYIPKNFSKEDVELICIHIDKNYYAYIEKFDYFCMLENDFENKIKKIKK